GINANSVFISADQFPFNGGFAAENMLILSLADLEAGNPLVASSRFDNLTDAAGFQYFAMRPAVTHGAQDDEFVVSSDPSATLTRQGTYLTVMDINPLSSPPTLTKRFVPVPAFTEPPNADQPGAGNRVPTNSQNHGSRI